MREITIDGAEINDKSECFVIAEVGHNHQGDVDKCMEIFQAAKDCGVDCVKLQKRNNRELYTSAFYNKPYENENSFGTTYGEHREALEFDMEQYLQLKAGAQDLGLKFFATAFDFSSAEFLAKVGVCAYKIASGDLKSLPLLKHVAQYGKPMIVSTGGATMEDIKQAYHTIMPINPQVSFLQCTASYPADYSQLDLAVITTYREHFPDAVIGLSDHENGIAMAPVAYILGARIIEKHFTMNHTWKGTDHAFSLEPIGMRKMVRDLRRLRTALGDGIKKVYPEEVAPITKMSKSLVAARDLSKGHSLTGQDIAMKTPGGGISLVDYDRVVGKTLKRDYTVDEAFQWDGLE